MRSTQRAGFVPIYVLKMGRHSVLRGAVDSNTLSALDATAAETIVLVPPFDSLMRSEHFRFTLDIELAGFT
jgi:hypothetical protein